MNERPRICSLCSSVAVGYYRYPAPKPALSCCEAHRSKVCFTSTPIPEWVPTVEYLNPDEGRRMGAVYHFEVDGPATVTGRHRPSSPVYEEPHPPIVRATFDGDTREGMATVEAFLRDEKGAPVGGIVDGERELFRVTYRADIKVVLKDAG